jgi:hypothetical protein
MRPEITAILEQRPEHIDEPTLCELAHLASLPLAKPIPATKHEILNHLDFMASVLAFKDVDLKTGKNRLAVYYKSLMDFPNEAIAHMARTACDTMIYFPKPVECVTIIRSYLSTDQRAQDRLKGIVFQQRQRNFETLLLSIRDGQLTQEEINDLPDRTKSIAHERGFLRRFDDGRFEWREPKPLEDERPNKITEELNNEH